MKKYILWLLIFLLPTQLGYHFWPNFSFVAGYKIDYLAPTIYLIDLIVISFLFFYPPKYKISPFFVFISIVNIIFANQPLLSLFFWGKIFLYLLLFNSLIKIKNLKKKIYPPLLLSTIFIVIIQFLHLFLQKSLGGLFYFLGERTFNFYTPNLAKINLPQLGIIIRPYSIFSHPNSLAGYLLISLVILKWCKPKNKSIITTLATIFTFSKMAIFTLLLLRIKNLKTIKKIIPLAIITGFLPLLVNFTDLKYIPHSFFLTRAYMGYPTLQIIKENFWTGTGLRGFIPSLVTHLNPSQINHSSLQPVHSLPLLFLSETGVVGFFYLLKIAKKIKINNLFLAQIMLIVAITGAVDHYWWTLPQNQIILTLALSLALKYKNDKKNRYIH